MHKRVISFLLSLVLMLSCLPVQVFATDTSMSTTLEVGKTYSIPITRYDRNGQSIDWSTITSLTASNKDAAIGLYTVQPNALVELGEDGKYTVTLAWAHYEYLDMLQFLKQGTVNNGESVESISMKAENIPNVFSAFDPQAVTEEYHYSSLFKEAIEAAEKEEDKNKYIENVTVSSEPDSNGFSYISLKLDNLDQWLYYKAFTSSLYPTGSKCLDVTDSSNHESIKEYAMSPSYCCIGGAFAFDAEQAQEVVALSKYQSKNTSRQVRCGADTFYGGINPPADEIEAGLALTPTQATQAMDKAISQSVQITQKDNGGLTATFTLAEDATVKEIYEVEKYQPYDTSKSYGSVRTNIQNNRQLIGDLYTDYLLKFDTMNSILDSTTKTFSLDFDSTEEAAWGKIVQIQMSDGSAYDVVLSISAVDNTVTFTSDNMTFTTEKDNIDTTGVFSSNPLTGGGRL